MSRPKLPDVRIFTGGHIFAVKYFFRSIPLDTELLYSFQELVLLAVDKQKLLGSLGQTLTLALIFALT